MTSNYKPPFSISDKTINLIAEISAQIERYAIRMEQEDGLLLRKINRIKTIHGSLAIEGNTLSENMITEIIEGKQVVAPVREIQEVKNAIRTYDAFHSLNPFIVKDMLKAHGMMMEALIEETGKFRSGNVGVFSGNKPVHVAPQPERVPSLMKDLFLWLKNSKDHLLIRSCVFHYEFEFIHPFSDGNGRMGRLWQSLILFKLHPLFAHLPVENIVFKKQQQYYNAIQESTNTADCSIFVEFMLGEILSAIKQRKGESLYVSKNVGANVGVNVGVKSLTTRIYEIIKQQPGANANEITLVIGNKTKRTVERHLAQLKAQNLIEFRGASKSGGYYAIEN